MIYAPILIPTLCRYEHFKNCVESLQANEWAQYTDLFIALDYPAKQEHWAGYLKIKEYINREITGFASVNLSVREFNCGVVGENSNCNLLRKSVIRKYDRFILTEDDNVFSPCFIEYMDKMLELSEEDERISSICGYSYPVSWKDEGNGIIKEQSFFSAWGYGVLVDREKKLYEKYNRKYQLELAHDLGKIWNLFQKSKKNFCFFPGFVWNKKLAMTDVIRSCLQVFENTYCIMPTVSLVRNCGWDGSGAHCNENIYNIDYSCQIISEEKNFFTNINNLSQISLLNENEMMINKFYSVTKKQVLMAVMKYLLIAIMRK